MTANSSQSSEGIELFPDDEDSTNDVTVYVYDDEDE